MENEINLEDVLLSYHSHREILEEFDSEMTDREKEEDAGYQYHRGCCDTAETWAKAFGINLNNQRINELDNDMER